MIIPVGFAQVNLRFGGAGYPTGAEVTFGIALPIGATDPAVVAADIAQEYFLAGFASLQVTSTTLLTVEVKFGPQATGASGSWTSGLVGSIGSPGIQPGTALLVKKLTLSGGRAGRGRFYWPGLPEADVTVSGGIDAAYLAAAQVVFDDFRTALVTALYTPMLLHAAGSPISTPSAITAFSVQPRAATQRRRLRR